MLPSARLERSLESDRDSGGSRRQFRGEERAKGAEIAHPTEENPTSGRS